MAQAVKCRLAATVSSCQTGWACSALRRGSAKAAEAPLLSTGVASLQPSDERAARKALANDTAVVLKQRVRLVVHVAAKILPRPIGQRCRPQIFISIRRVRP